MSIFRGISLTQIGFFDVRRVEDRGNLLHSRELNSTKALRNHVGQVSLENCIGSGRAAFFGRSSGRTTLKNRKDWLRPENGGNFRTSSKMEHRVHTLTKPDRQVEVRAA